MVLGAAAVVLVPKYLLGDGGSAEKETPKGAGSINTNHAPDGIANKTGDTNAPAVNTLSVPLAPNGPSDTSFTAVTQHLDTGGSFYFFLPQHR